MVVVVFRRRLASLLSGPALRFASLPIAMYLADDRRRCRRALDGSFAFALATK